jgi:phenylalanyl-tRNA synthetase beta chain
MPTSPCLKSAACSRKSTAQPKEERRVAIALTGQRQLPFWSGDERDAKFDNYDLKGLAEDLLEQFGLRGVVFTTNPASTSPVCWNPPPSPWAANCRWANSASCCPALAKKYDLRDAVYLAEFNLDLLLAKRNAAKAFKPLPSFPSIRRDVALLVPETVTHQAVLNTVKQTKPANLETWICSTSSAASTCPKGRRAWPTPSPTVRRTKP